MRRILLPVVRRTWRSACVLHQAGLNSQAYYRERGKQDTGVRHPWDRHKSEEVTWLLYMARPRPHLHKLLSALVTFIEWGNYLGLIWMSLRATRPPHQPALCAQSGPDPHGSFYFLPETPKEVWSCTSAIWRHPVTSREVSSLPQ